MTRLAMEHDAINLAQGFPDFPAPEEVKQAAKDAIDADLNQYPITWGEPELRGAIAAHYERRYGMHVDPLAQLCVTCGSTEAMISSLLGVIDPGDEVVIFEPYYEDKSRRSEPSWAHVDNDLMLPRAHAALCSIPVTTRLHLVMRTNVATPSPA
jgi:DNA-binding transcriptional MocR family regulator